MENKIDYLKTINEKMYDANILSQIPTEKHSLALELLKTRKEIKNKNGLFVFLQLKFIDKKIDKLKNLNNEKIK